MCPDAQRKHPSTPALAGPLDELIHHRAPEVLRDVASNPALDEDLALALLTRRDLPNGVIDNLSKNGAAMKSRKVQMAVVCHPRTPRHISLPIARHLYTFELMQIALTPTIVADIRMAVEEAIVTRLETVSIGERITLAKRASARVAAALLLDKDERVIEAALSNPFMTEAWIVKTLGHEDATQTFIEQVCRHSKWSLRKDIHIALLRNANTPLARAIQFAHALPSHVLRDVLRHSALHAATKMYLLKELEEREKKRAARNKEVT